MYGIIHIFLRGGRNPSTLTFSVISNTSHTKLFQTQKDREQEEEKEEKEEEKEEKERSLSKKEESFRSLIK